MGTIAPESDLFIYLSIEGLYSHRVTSAIFTSSNLTQVTYNSKHLDYLEYNTKHAHYRTNVKHINIIQVSPFGIALVKNKMANKVRRCWYHCPFPSGVSIRIRFFFNIKKRIVRVSYCLRSFIGGVAYVTVFNSSATWAFRFRGYKCMLVISVFP